MLRFNEKFIKNYNEDSNKGYILDADVKYPINLHDLDGDLLFLPEIMKTSKCKKQYAICMIKHVVHIRSLKQAFNHELILEKVHQVIQFNQEVWLKLYIDMNIKLREKGKKLF